MTGTIQNLLLASALVASGAALAQEATPGPIGVVSAFHEALESGEADAALSHLGPEVVIYEGGGVEASRDEYASHHLHSDMKFLQSVETEIIDQSSGMDGEHAWVLTRSETHGTYGGKPVDLSGTETMILEKTPEGWKIVHIHWSSRSKSKER